MAQIEIKIPNIGDFSEVEVIEVFVKSGDSLQVDDPMLSLESDKATMEIPAPNAGVVQEVFIKEGMSVSKGTLILMLEQESAKAEISEPASDTASSKTSSAESKSSEATLHAEVLVLGAGPGGYTAAFRSADLGKQTVLVEQHATLGGVCLNVGCIPSKTLLHAAKVINESKESSEFGVHFETPTIRLEELRAWKEKTVAQLTGGLQQLAKQRKVQVVQGKGTFVDAHHLKVEGEKETITISFDNVIIAAGSHATKIPGFPYEDSRLIRATGALALRNIPKRMLIIGGGIIGLEMAIVYNALGTKITVVEFMSSLIPGADPVLVKPLYQRIKKQYENIFLSTKVTAIEAEKAGLKVHFEGASGGTTAPESDIFDSVLLAIGRRPNGRNIGAEKAGIAVNEQGFIPVDSQQRSSVPHIFAIGDIVGQPMLAHKAVHEGKIAAEVIAGQKVAFDAQVIPSVAYTDPEIAWVGLTETEAKKKDVSYEKAIFPWVASGRALSLGRTEGQTQLLFDPESKKLLGAGIVGVHAGDLIAEMALAIEMGCDALDIGLTIHPHPTLSETVAMAAEMFEGSITDLLPPKKCSKKAS